MKLLDKYDLISSTWAFLEYENVITDEDKIASSYYNDFCSMRQYVDFMFYTLIKTYKKTRHTKELIKRLKIDALFEISCDGNGICNVLYGDEYLDFRLDLMSHSPMGFGDGGSSFRQMSLAILSKASSDAEALLYYDDLSDFLKKKSAISSRKVSNVMIDQMEILEWLATQIFLNPVKRTCKVLGLSQVQLAKYIQVSESSVNRWASRPDDIPQPTRRLFDILIKSQYLEDEAEDLRQLKRIFKKSVF